MVWRYIFSISVLFAASCGSDEDKQEDNVIAVVGTVMDTTINSGAPDLYSFSESLTVVGTNTASGVEQRLLLFIPELLQLYREDVVLSSIAEIRLELVADGVAVNPSNIKLYCMGVTWTPYVSWNSRFALSDNYNWGTPGGDVLTFDPVSPDIEKYSGSLKKLSFDLTSILVESIVSDQPIYGFNLQVDVDELNSEQTIAIRTTNGPDDTDPRAILTFSKEDILQP